MESSHAKIVRFPSPLHELEQIICELSQESDETLRNRWFTRTDFVVIKKTARMIAKESRRFGYSTSLDGTFIADSDQVQSKLNMWCKHGHSRRGLEEWTNKDHHGVTRQQHRKEAIQSVLNAQTVMRSTNRGSCNEQDLAKIYAMLSRKSRTFAEQMGKADEYAVSSNEFEDICRKRMRLPASPFSTDGMRENHVDPHSTEDGGESCMGAIQEDGVNASTPRILTASFRRKAA